jgi:endonuclease/exonuclease/phosphatase family metal-dependent hydrolase
MRIRFMTQNIWGVQGGWPARRDALVATLRQADPDILVLQEVVLTDTFDQLATLGIDRLPHRVHQANHAGNDMPGARDMGLAIAARWPFDVVAHVDLRTHRDDAARPWAALVVRFDFGARLGSLLLVAAKPSWQLDREATREVQALRLARLATSHRGRMPTIMLGDFDATPQAASMRFLTGKQSLQGESTYFADAWESLHPEESGYTWTTANPTAVPEIERLIGPGDHHRRIDYILVGRFDPRRSVDSRILSCEVITGVEAGVAPPSDHYGVVADIEFSVRAGVA